MHPAELLLTTLFLSLFIDEFFGLFRWLFGRLQ